MRYLTEQEVIAINYFLIDRYSPGEQKGIKDASLMNSAVERSKQSAFGEEAYQDVYEKGAALFESIAKNHCFQNGNKRTAFVALLQFLSYNGYHFVMEQKTAEDFVVDVVTHHYTFREITDVIQEHSLYKV
ncbi:type II toxin-antitoxin system death-on-curing family toxin [Salimicrobium flavidum]|uniref:Death on curing protein n=1 Tax=Salimicrobium flavidum TaxID=570947 RepID=A0A1N7KMN2_9BACI|nr:type II toxin-antitoxin system death-on-curing family toxin [Salimicrobium flavidum]SIS62853.1 death on curing protein [Salimicrobium flavidum]